MNLSRFGVSIEENLLADFDRLIRRKGYANRSEAIRALIRNLLLDTRVEEDAEAEVIGSLTLVYDHNAGDLSSRLTELEHRFHHAVVSTLHVHFDERNCLEVLVVRGRSAEVRKISDSLIGTRGVHHGRLIIGSGVGPSEGRGAHAHPREHRREKA
jgi:CopG family nickel-responsive transcriptional regulator